MSIQLHRVALWVRLLLVCIVLTGASAPTRTTGYREAVVAIATATATTRASAERPATPTLARTIRAGGHTRPAVARAPERLAVRVAPRRSPAPPRRIYLIHSALLC